MSASAIGLIARCDNRGIASLTYEFWRHMKPAKVLVILMDDPVWAEYPERYAGDNVTLIHSDMITRALDEKVVREWLDGLDFVFTSETLYDWRIADWAREVGCKTIVQGNPELYAHHRHSQWSQPDQWVWPTPWLLDHPDIPDGPVVPVPTVQRPSTAADPRDDTLRVLHVAGHAAVGDRNGTREFIEALPSLRQRIHVTIVGQDGMLPVEPRVRGEVSVEVNTHGVDDRWDLYRGQHVVVLPRKYGGLCLPALEALASGCTVLMPRVSPNEIWPGPRIDARKGRMIRTKFGPIVTSAVHPMHLAHEIDELARNRDILADEMLVAHEWAEQNSWAILGPQAYEPLFA